MIELFYIGMPVVRTDGRSLARSVYGHVITKFSWMGSLPHILTNDAPLRASRARAPLKKTKHPGDELWRQFRETAQTPRKTKIIENSRLS